MIFIRGNLGLPFNHGDGEDDSGGDRSKESECAGHEGRKHEREIYFLCFFEGREKAYFSIELSFKIAG